MLIITGCQTVSKKIDKSVTEEEKVLSRFLNKTSEELRIEFGNQIELKILGQVIKFLFIITQD